MRAFWRENWIYVVVGALYAWAFLAELVHGFQDDRSFQVGLGNRWQNIMQYTATWQALPPDYPQPFYTSPEERKRIGRVGVWEDE